MEENNIFYPEEEVIQGIQDGKYNWVDYIKLVPSYSYEEYLLWMTKNSQTESPESALRFIEEQESLLQADEE